MAKLKIIQAQEAAQRHLEQQAAEEKERKKLEKKAKKEKKGKDKPKGKGQEYAPVAVHDDPTAEFELGSPNPYEMSPIKKSGDLPPMVQFSPEKPPPRPIEAPMAHSEIGHLDHNSQDDRQVDVSQSRYEETDSDEDIPLSRIKKTAPVKPKSVPTPRQPPVESSDDEDAHIPLSQLRRAKAKSPTRNQSTSSPAKPVLSLNTDFAPIQSDELLTTGSLGLAVPLADAKTMQVLTQPITITQPTGGEEEDDDVPLLLRQAHIKATNNDDDDVPLGIRQSMRNSSYNSFQGMVPPHPGAFMGHNPYSPYLQQPQFPAQQQWGHQPYPPHQYMGMGMGMGMGYPGVPGNGYPQFQAPPQQIPQMSMGHMTSPSPMGIPGTSVAGIPSMPSMTMPPLPDFGLMDPTGAGPQHDNIDNWRKAIATPSASASASVSGGSKA